MCIYIYIYSLITLAEERLQLGHVRLGVAGANPLRLTHTYIHYYIYTYNVYIYIYIYIHTYTYTYI